MTDPTPTSAGPSAATRALAALVAKRKAALSTVKRGGDREPEQAAAARSAAKSKPALRK